MNNKINSNKINSNELVKNIIENKNQIKKFMGYTTRKMPPIIERKLEEELSAISELMEISYYYKILTIEESKEFWQYNVFKEQRFKAEKLALMTYTIGAKLEIQIEKHSQSSEMIRGIILDKAGVVALDCLKDMLMQIIQEETSLKKVWEIYPANKDFPIQGQSLILKHIGSKVENIDKISINQYYQLSPIKSVALAVILGQEEDNYDRCNLCKSCTEEI